MKNNNSSVIENYKNNCKNNDSQKLLLSDNDVTANMSMKHEQ